MDTLLLPPSNLCTRAGLLSFAERIGFDDGQRQSHNAAAFNAVYSARWSTTRVESFEAYDPSDPRLRFDNVIGVCLKYPDYEKRDEAVAFDVHSAYTALLMHQSRQRRVYGLGPRAEALTRTYLEWALPDFQPLPVDEFRRSVGSLMLS